MRVLMLHVDHFSSSITKRGRRSKLVEDYNSNSKTTEVDEALLILASVEKQDESSPVSIAKKIVDEIAQLARQLKVNTIVLHPFAHLFADLSSPDIALATLKRTEEGLVQRGFTVTRTPFGWFNTLELRVKGHPLSRVARIVSSDVDDSFMEVNIWD
ncbi:MAG: threonyl-tRNA synthetase editing domain-containing protein [Candidatus Heimdallarchaeota archaeon]